MFHRKGRKGFTLIELIIVSIIIVIGVSMIVPLSVDYINEMQLYNCAVQIQQDILLIQNLAITHSSDNAARFRIRFYPSLNQYIVEASEDANLVSGKGKLIRRKLPNAFGFPRFFSKNVPNSVVFGVHSAPPDMFVELSFNNMGVPLQGGGHINLINSVNSKQVSVIVSIIGRVRIDWVKR